MLKKIKRKNEVILSILLIACPLIGFASLKIDNQTNNYVSLYFTSSGLCPGKDDRYSLPNTPNFELSRIEMRKYCKFHDICDGYIYTSETLNYAKICNGTFVGTFIFDLKNQVINNLYIANTEYRVTGKNPNTFKISYNNDTPK